MSEKIKGLPRRVKPGNCKVKHIEYVNVTLELPKGILEFLKAKVEDVKGYLENAIIQCVGADIDTLEIFGFKNDVEAREAINRYALKEVLKNTVVEYLC